MQSLEAKLQAPMQPQTVNNALPADHKLEHYIINKALSGDDFSLTYKATDSLNNIPVIIKEYFPATLASRNPETLDINPASADSKQDYEWGMTQYFDEGSELIALNHPNIVNVKACIKAHNTVYVITDYIEGINLEAYARGNTRSEEALLSLLSPLLSGLQAIHNEGFLHSDLTPSNILIQERTKTPIIINLGDVKHIFRNRKKEIAQVVSPGYSAYEQYHTHNNQGAWTDIYAMGCILYRIISGKTPESSMARLAATVDNDGQDILVPAIEAGKGRYSQAFLASIDHAIKLQRADRPESVSVWATEFKINGKSLVLTEPSALVIQEEISPETNNLHIDFNLDTQAPANHNKHYRVIAAMVISMLVTIGGGAYYYQSIDNNKLDEYSDLEADSIYTTNTEATPIIETTAETALPSFTDTTTQANNDDSVITDNEEPAPDTTEAEVKPTMADETVASESNTSIAPSSNTNTVENNATVPSSNEKDTTNKAESTPAKSQKKTSQVVATKNSQRKTNRKTRKKRTKSSIKQQLSMDKRQLYRLLQPPKPKQQHKKKTAKAKTKYQKQWDAKQKQQKHRAQWKKKKLAQLQRQKRLKQQQETRQARKNVKQIEDTLIGDKDW